jgi:hypothetical protein
LALQNASARVGYAASLYELSRFLGEEMDDVAAGLARLVGFAVSRYDALGADGAIGLIDLLPTLPAPEKIALAMTLNQRETFAAVVASMQRPEIEVAALITLGLVRVPPELESRLDT